MRIDRWARGLARAGIPVGIFLMFASLILGAEDGPMPAHEVRRKKAVAVATLWTGGGLAIGSACGLYFLTRGDRRA